VSSGKTMLIMASHAQAGAADHPGDDRQAMGQVMAAVAGLAGRDPWR